MRDIYAQWPRYAAYTLLVLAVAVGGYYFLYVEQRAEQLGSDRLALLQESSGYFTKELARVKRIIRNTVRDSSTDRRFLVRSAYDRLSLSLA